MPAEAVGADLGGLVRREWRAVERLYVHVDLDVLDIEEGRANPYAVAGRVSAAALRAAGAALGAAAPAAALTLSAYDPVCDEDGRVRRAAAAAAAALLTHPERG